MIIAFVSYLFRTFVRENRNKANVMHKQLLRFFCLVALFVAATATLSAQEMKTHKVKKNETIYGIARDNGITIEQLVAANPGMEKPDYVLKKGKVINIPVLAATAVGNPNGDIRQRAIRLGVMLPLNNQNGDGQRMIEYYRGVLMACDTLRKEGISVDVHAWNTPQDADISTTLANPDAARCDIIFGPLYLNQTNLLSEFVTQHKSLLVIPFSVNAPELYFNRNIFQVYQTPSDITESTARRFTEWFKDAHPIVVDCSDAESSKGAFTSSLRQQLEKQGIAYSLTSLQSNEVDFARAFTMAKQNIIVLNSSRISHLKSMFGRLEPLLQINPGLRVSIFGYEEWMSAEPQMSANFHRFNMYLPAPYFTNIYSDVTEDLQQRYRRNFGVAMQDNFPRYAITGYDQTIFFLRGLHKYGMSFDGAKGRVGYTPVQTPLKFERIGNGGLQNRAFMFIHYKPEGTIETINY